MQMNKSDEERETDADKDSNDDECDVRASTYQQKRSHHQKTRVGTTAFISPHILERPILVSLATRLKMSPADQACFTAAVVEEAGEDILKISSSYSSAARARRKVVEQIASKYKEEWSPPKLATLHWDSKIMNSLSNRNVTEERLVVMFGDVDNLQLLGVPHYAVGCGDSSGNIIANLTCNLLTSWRCSDSIVNMTFDTTASNTGHISAACVCIQNELKKPLLWSACRHHVGEELLSQVFADLNIEASRSSDIQIFSRFFKHYHKLPQSYKLSQLARFDAQMHSDEARRFLEQCRLQVLETSSQVLQFKRDDYKEFIKLCDVFLNTEASDKVVTFKRPGTIHRARWMSKVLYPIKICLLQEELWKEAKSTIATQQQIKNLREFVLFATIIYSWWWLTCGSAADTPWNDLQLHRQILKYEVVTSKVSKSAFHALSRYRWYSTEEIILLALFSTRVPVMDKHQLADKLLALKPEFHDKVPHKRFGSG